MLQDIAERMSARMPDEQRARFVELMAKQLDIAKLTTAMRESMDKNVTADEIRALADFYGSEIGRSAMAKFGTYMADGMPTIQAEVMAAVGRVQSELSAAPPAAPTPAAPPQEQPGQEPEQPAPAVPPKDLVRRSGPASRSPRN